MVKETLREGWRLWWNWPGTIGMSLLRGTSLQHQEIENSTCIDDVHMSYLHWRADISRQMTQYKYTVRSNSIVYSSLESLIMNRRIHSRTPKECPKACQSQPKHLKPKSCRKKIRDEVDPRYLLDHTSTSWAPVVAVPIFPDCLVRLFFVNYLLWLDSHMYNLRCHAIGETIVCEPRLVVEHFAHEN